METTSGKLKLIVYLGVVRDQKILFLNYREPPNPLKCGWWIPAPELAWGQDPLDCVKKLQKSLGLYTGTPLFREIESFETNGGWHLIFHYTLKTNSEIIPQENITGIQWISRDDLPTFKNIAHGEWERSLAQKILNENLQ